MKTVLAERQDGHEKLFSKESDAKLWETRLTGHPIILPSRSILENQRVVPLDAGGIVKQHVIDSLASQMLQLPLARFQTAFTQLPLGHLILIKSSYGKAIKKLEQKQRTWDTNAAKYNGDVEQRHWWCVVRKLLSLQFKVNKAEAQQTLKERKKYKSPPLPKQGRYKNKENKKAAECKYPERKRYNLRADATTDYVWIIGMVMISLQLLGTSLSKAVKNNYLQNNHWPISHTGVST